MSFYTHSCEFLQSTSINGEEKLKSDAITEKSWDCATKQYLQSKKGGMLEELMNFETSYRV